MLDEAAPNGAFYHVAVGFEHYVLVIGGWWYSSGISYKISCKQPYNKIWMYNLYTEQWEKYGMGLTDKKAPQIDGACAVVIKSVKLMHRNPNIFKIVL